MEIVYIFVAVIAVIALYFLFFRKEGAPPLPEPKRERLERPEAERAERAPRKEKDEGEAAPAPPAAPPPPEEAVEVAEAPAEEPAPPEPARPSLTQAPDVDTLRRGLARSRSEAGFFGKLRALFSGKKELSADIVDEIEEVLISSDVGVKTTQTMLARMRETLSGSDHVDSAKVWSELRAEAKRMLEAGGRAGAFRLAGKPTVVLMVGVNGAGKTTTIGKLATRLKSEGRSCVLAAGDTFRAAAVQQLVVWGQRVGCEVVRGKEGADPGSVVFDAIKRAQEIGADVVLADTAGRLHTKTNLMTEMTKIARTAGKALEGAPHEVLLVLDATNGQNAIAQAQEFQEALPVTGIVLTKLDGTAKGGVILGISDTLELPVSFIGLGERPNDLHEFVPDEFVEALLGRENEANAA